MNTENLNNKQQESLGITAFLEPDATYFERLPMLDVVLDRFIRFFIAELRSSTSDNISADVHSISSMRFEDYINNVPSGTLTCIFKIKELENLGLIILDRNIINNMTNIFLGGWRSHEPKSNGDPDTYTIIERKIAEYIIHVIFGNLKNAFSLVKELNFSIERIEMNPRFATVVQLVDPVILMQVKVDIDKTSGIIEIMLPYITLEPINDLLRKVFMGDNIADIGRWEQHFNNMIEETTVKLDVVLGRSTVSIDDIKNMKVGTFFKFDNFQELAIAEINGQEIFSCTPGHVGNRVSIQVKEVKNLIKNIQ